VIYLINLLVITGLLLATSRQVSPEVYGRLFFDNTLSFLDVSRSLVEWSSSSVTDLLGVSRKN
jgi:hypothetical protein